MDNPICFNLEEHEGRVPFVMYERETTLKGVQVFECGQCGRQETLETDLSPCLPCEDTCDGEYPCTLWEKWGVNHPEAVPGI